jgi:hypothetical protein
MAHLLGLLVAAEIAGVGGRVDRGVKKRAAAVDSFDDFGCLSSTSLDAAVDSVSGGEWDREVLQGRCINFSGAGTRGYIYGRFLTGH